MSPTKPPAVKSLAADRLAEAARLVRSAGRLKESQDGLHLTCVGLAQQISFEERSHRRVMAWLAEREAQR